MVKYDDVYGQIKAAVQKSIAKTRNGDEISMEQAFESEVLEKVWMIFGGDIVER